MNITNSPKCYVDLHCHLSGSIPANTFSKLLIKYLKKGNSFLLKHKKWLIEYFSLPIDEQNLSYTFSNPDRQCNQTAQQKSSSSIHHQVHECAYEENLKLPTLEQCFILFACIHQVIQEKEDFQLLVREVLDEYLEECTYIELRTTPRILSDVPNGFRGYVELLINEINNYFIEKEPSLQESSTFFSQPTSRNSFLLSDSIPPSHFSSAQSTIKSESVNIFKNRIYPLTKVNILLSINRTMSYEDAEEITNLALEFSQKTTPSVTCSVIGLDFSGNPTKNSFKDFVNLFELSIKAGLTNAIHFAEVYNDEDTEFILNFIKSNHKAIYDPLMTAEVRNENCKHSLVRLGHGCCMNDIHLKELLKIKKVPIEICLTSNKIANMVEDMQNHLVSVYIQNNYPISLSTDDRGIFSTSMKQEFKYIEEQFNISKDKLTTLQRDAIRYIGELDPEIRSQIQERHFEQFK